MIRNGLSHNDVQHEAGPDVRFGLAYERLSAEDAERSRLLAVQCRIEDPDEGDYLPPVENPCPCGCGRPIAKPSTKYSNVPKYATKECRYRMRWLRAKAGKERAR